MTDVEADIDDDMTIDMEAFEEIVGSSEEKKRKKKKSEPTAIGWANACSSLEVMKSMKEINPDLKFISIIIIIIMNFNNTACLNPFSETQPEPTLYFIGVLDF